MKHKPLFISRLIVTVIVAGLVSTVIGFILLFISGILGQFEQSINSINVTMSVIFGLMVGYRLNDLVKEFKK